MLSSGVFVGICGTSNPGMASEQSLTPSSELKLMLYSLISLLVAVWFVGFMLHYGGSFIHMLLLLAGVIFVYDLLVGRRSTV